MGETPLREAFADQPPAVSWGVYLHHWWLMHSVGVQRVSRNLSGSRVFLALKRSVVTLGAATFLLGGALQTGAQNKEMMLAGRFFAGLAIGQLVSPQ